MTTTADAEQEHRKIHPSSDDEDTTTTRNNNTTTTTTATNIEEKKKEEEEQTENDKKEKNNNTASNDDDNTDTAAAATAHTEEDVRMLKEMVLRYHRQRSELRTAIEKLATVPSSSLSSSSSGNVATVPLSLIRPLQGILYDMGSNNNSVQAQYEDFSSAGQQHQQHHPVDVTNIFLESSPSRFRSMSPSSEKQQQHQYGEELISPSTASNASPVVVATHHAALSLHAIERGQGRYSTAASNTAVTNTTHTRSTAASINASSSSSSSSPVSTSSDLSPNKKISTSAGKSFLLRAHEAKMNGNRREEVQVLLEYLREGQDGHIASMDIPCTCRVLRQIGEAHCALKEFISAEQYFFDWYLIAEKLENNSTPTTTMTSSSSSASTSSDSSRALTALGDCCSKRGDLEAARDWYLQARTRCRR